MPNDNLVPLFDKWAENYDAQVTKEKTGFFNKYELVLNEALRVGMELCPPPAKILDIGIGTGNAAGLFINMGYQVYGVDISSKMLDKCSEKHPSIKLEKGDFLDIPFKGEIFDLIISGYALHHLTDNEKNKAISVFKNFLSPKGAIIIFDIMFYDNDALHEAQKTLGDKFDYDEHYAYVTQVSTSFKNEGFITDVRRLTEYVWIATAKRV